MQLIRLHADAGAERLLSSDSTVTWRRSSASHHDRLDGSGLSRPDWQPDPARCEVLAVADVMEAMVSHRPYRPGLPIEMALKEIEDGAGSRYDVKISEIASRLSASTDSNSAFSLAAASACRGPSALKFVAHAREKCDLVHKKGPAPTRLRLLGSDDGPGDRYGRLWYPLVD